MDTVQDVPGAVDKAARAAAMSQKPVCLWFTGLSGAGKTTLACLLEERLHGMRRHVYRLDGDELRRGLCRDLGFTDAARVENIRRVSEVARLMVDAGLIVIVSLISPFRAERGQARALFAQGEFLEVYLDASLAVCEQRDPKGLYRNARCNAIPNFTGLTSPYEPPESPDVRLSSGSRPPEDLVEQLLAAMRRAGVLDHVGHEA